MTSTRQFELDVDNNRIVFRRSVKASAETLFDAWTQPATVSKWWDPTGRDLVACKIDLRVNGDFKFINQGHEDHPFEGTYLEIQRPHRLVFKAMGAVGTVLLEEGDGSTLMTVEMTCASREQLEQFVHMGIAEGTAMTLDNLVTRTLEGAF